MDPVIEQLRNDLRKKADPLIRENGLKFFREGVRLYGFRNATIHTMSREYYRKLPDRSKQFVFSLCGELWSSGYLEESLIACNWSYAVRKQYEPADFHVFEDWVGNYVTNWASCDTFCNHTVGELVVQFPGRIERLKGWTRSENRWLRRGAAVTLILPARRGMFLDDIFEIATLLLTDSDDMVQKGYGWMLKAASEAHQKEVFEFVMRNKMRMPRTSLRYAIEKMPVEMKSAAMRRE